jgi:hypothetical protein
MTAFPQIQRAALVAISLVLASCATPQVGRFSNVLVTDLAKSANCPGFKVTNQSARDFFTIAKRISATELHDFYDYGPCFVAGSFVVDSETWRWELSSGGTATIFPPRQEAFLVADPSQQSPLGH